MLKVQDILHNSDFDSIVLTDDVLRYANKGTHLTLDKFLFEGSSDALFHQNNIYGYLINYDGTLYAHGGLYYSDVDSHLKKMVEAFKASANDDFSFQHQQTPPSYLATRNAEVAEFIENEEKELPEHWKFLVQNGVALYVYKAGSRLDINPVLIQGFTLEDNKIVGIVYLLNLFLRRPNGEFVKSPFFTRDVYFIRGQAYEVVQKVIARHNKQAFLLSGVIYTEKGYTKFYRFIYSTGHLTSYLKRVFRVELASSSLVSLINEKVQKGEGLPNAEVVESESTEGSNDNNVTPADSQEVVSEDDKKGESPASDSFDSSDTESSNESSSNDDGESSDGKEQKAGSIVSVEDFVSDLYGDFDDVVERVSAVLSATASSASSISTLAIKEALDMVNNELEVDLPSDRLQLVTHYVRAFLNEREIIRTRNRNYRHQMSLKADKKVKRGKEKDESKGEGKGKEKGTKKRKKETPAPVSALNSALNVQV